MSEALKSFEIGYRDYRLRFTDGKYVVTRQEEVLGSFDTFTEAEALIPCWPHHKGPYPKEETNG